MKNVGAPELLSSGVGGTVAKIDELACYLIGKILFKLIIKEKRSWKRDLKATSL